MPDLLALGELLIDFTPAGETTDQIALFARNPGGAPANVAAQAAVLGCSSGFIGRVGDDGFGRFLKKTLEDYNVDTSGLSLDPDNATTLAFVQLSEDGDRSFSFYRNPGADTCLKREHIPDSLLESCKILCCGSLILTAEPSRSTVYGVLKDLRQKGKIIAYDPNWRPMLWPSEGQGIAGMKSGLPYCHILKVSDEELTLITGCDIQEQAIQQLLDMGIQIIIVTMGAKGCLIASRQGIFNLPTYDVHVVDTTGSGDSFFGAFLYKILQFGKPLEQFTLEDLKECGDFANAAGALCASRYGAIPAMANQSMVESCRKTVPLLK